MPWYKVTIRQEREWGGTVQADSAEEAESIAHREAQFDLIVDEKVTSSLLAEDDEWKEDAFPAEPDYVYYT